jgi:aldose sugar dehydrogenase
MKSPVVIVTAALTMAILLAASFLIATGTRGENALARASARSVLTSPVTE